MDNLDNLDPNQIKQLIGLLQKMLPNQTEKPKAKKKEKKQTLKSVSRSKRAVEESRENKFLSMPEMNMHKSDVAIDKKLQKFPPTPRSRDFEPVSVVCRVCGSSEQISPKLVPESLDRYKCNRCSSTEG